MPPTSAAASNAASVVFRFLSFSLSILMIRKGVQPGLVGFVFLFLLIFPMLYFPLHPPQGGTTTRLQPIVFVIFRRCFHFLRLLSVLPYFPLRSSSFVLVTEKWIMYLLRSLCLVFRTTMRRN